MLRVLALPTCALALTVLATPARAASLAEGQSSFWAGQFVADARVDDPSACDLEGPCFDYPVDVTAQHAKVLRAALASFDDSNGWGVRLLDPSGAEVATGSTYTLNGIAENYDVEVFAHDPAPGRWTLQVIPQNVHMGDFQARAAVDPAAGGTASSPAACVPRETAVVRLPARLRARSVRRLMIYVSGHLQRSLGRPQPRVRVSLKGLSPGVARLRVVALTAHGRRRFARNVVTCSAAPSAPRAAGAVDQPPDLAADPPWHLTFQQPPPMVVVEGGNYAALAGVHNPTMQIAGQPVYGCLAEETVEQGAHRCLRFTSGFASLGPGPFEVFGSSATLAAPQGGPLFQKVYRSDGSHYARPAGAFVFHHIHAHYHVLGIAEFRFYRVGADHTLTEAGKVLKEGFCLGNIKMYDWHSFAQAEIDPKSVDNCEPTPQADGSYRFYEGIANGWEDSYKWQTSGQFIDFGDNSDGLYVLRVVANPERHILETTYDDNVAYAYMQVSGNDVRVIERGHGRSPWDPAKVVEDPVITR